MSRYALHFDPRARDEWERLDGSLKAQFKKVLGRRLAAPRVPSAALSGDLHDCYKIKLRDAGYRLVYRVDDGRLVVLVIAIGRRDAAKVYRQAGDRRRT